MLCYYLLDYYLLDRLTSAIQRIHSAQSEEAALSGISASCILTSDIRPLE